MAANTQARMQFSLQDEGGTLGSLSLPMHIDSAQTVLQVRNAWNVQAGLLDAVTGCKILHGGVFVGDSTAETAFTPKSPSPAVDSRIEETGNLDFGVTGTRYVYDWVIPGIADAFVVIPGYSINESAGAMAAYIASGTAAVLGGVFTNHTYQTLTGLVDSFFSDRKRRRSIKGSSVRRP